MASANLTVSLPTVGGAIDAVGSGVNTLANVATSATVLPAQAVGYVTQSLVDFMESVTKNLGVARYGTLWPRILLALLFIHFFLYNLENIQNISPVWKQSLNELRIYIQVTLVVNLVYYGGVVIGIVQGSGLGGSMQLSNYQFASYIGFVLAVCLIVNKFCVIMTGDNNPEYIKVGVEANPIVNPSKNSGQRYVYVWLSWIQNVTDILTQKLFPGIVLGYAVGAAAKAIRGVAMDVA